MTQQLLKKEIAALACTSPRTMRDHRRSWDWLERCRTRRPGRPTYNARQVKDELRRRNLID